MTPARRGGFSPAGPAVQLAAAGSIFPFQLARFWQQQGLATVLVTRDRQRQGDHHQGTSIVCSSDFRKTGERLLNHFPVSVLVRSIEKALNRPFRGRYYRRTGRPRGEAREDRFAAHLVAAPSAARAALSFGPRFVFGHEVTHYGLATAMCHGTPRILFPWGGDVFIYAETSPFMSWIVGRALRSVDLVLPSSTTAARHIRDRFGVPPEVVRPLSWGIDTAMFRRADRATRERLLAELGIPPHHQIVLNSRRFSPIWGCYETLDAFFSTADRHPAAHFVLLAGSGVETHIARARSMIESHGLADRFTVLDGHVSLSRVAELMSIADVFTSLMGLGDMRSASVLQAAAAGGVPVIDDSAEHREMVRQGFAAFLVHHAEPRHVVHAIATALDTRTADEFRTSNRQFITEHEDQSRQFQKMLRLIDEVCDRYGGAPSAASR